LAANLTTVPSASLIPSAAFTFSIHKFNPLIWRIPSTLSLPVWEAVKQSPRFLFWAPERSPSETDEN